MQDRLSLMLDSMILAVDNGHSYDGIVSVPEIGLEDFGRRPGPAGWIDSGVELLRTTKANISRMVAKLFSRDTQPSQTPSDAEKPSPIDSGVHEGERLPRRKSVASTAQGSPPPQNSAPSQGSPGPEGTVPLRERPPSQGSPSPHVTPAEEEKPQEDEERQPERDSPYQERFPRKHERGQQKDKQPEVTEDPITGQVLPQQEGSDVGESTTRRPSMGVSHGSIPESEVVGLPSSIDEGSVNQPGPTGPDSKKSPRKRESEPSEVQGRQPRVSRTKEDSSS